MCRWIAYSGTPIYLHAALFEPEHSLIVQSLRAKSSETTTNGDGFGIGWYNDREFPGVFKDVRPAWNDSNPATATRSAMTTGCSFTTARSRVTNGCAAT
jgi:glutamine amidotransferase